MGRVLRRALGGLLVAGLLVTALAFYVYSPYLTLTAANGGPATSARPPRTSGSSASTPTPSPTPVPSASASAAPSGQGSIRLVATVRRGDVFDVTETVRLPAPVTRLTLAPPDLRGAGSDLRAHRAVATGLVVRAGDRSVRLSRRTVRQTMIVPLRRPTDRFVIRYRLHGTIDRSEPSSAGRGLGAVAPLVSGMPDEMPVAAAFPGHAVLNLRCAGLPTDQEVCIDGNPPKVRVNQDLPYRASLVVIQLDLTKAGR